MALSGGFVGTSPARGQAVASNRSAEERKQFKACRAALYKKDDKAAYRHWIPLAENDNAYAQFMVGIMSEGGHGVSQDYAVAAGWYRKAAEQGKASAQWGLGLLFERGDGVPQDCATAANWYRKAADQGQGSDIDSDCEHSIGDSLDQRG